MATAKKAGRGNITAAARKKGALSKSRRGIFNRYLKALQGRAVEKTRAKISEIEGMLDSGMRLKQAPVFKGGKRVGTREKELPLLPSERAILMAQQRKLKASLTRKAPDDLRERFLAMLPEYAARNELTRDILIEVGVPEADLDEVGIDE